jgi:hypothetical protein
MFARSDLVDEELVAEARVLDGKWVLEFCSGACADRYEVDGRNGPLDPDSPQPIVAGLFIDPSASGLILITANSFIDSVERRRCSGPHHRHGSSRR